MKTNNFRFRNFEDRHKDDLILHHWNENFIGLKKMWESEYQYIEYTVSVLEEVCQNNFDKQDFEDHCKDVFYVEYFPKDNLRITLKGIEKIITKLDDIRETLDWDSIKGHIVEYIVNFVFTKRMNMKLFIEPDVFYKKKPLIYRNNRVTNKNFDILSHKKRTFFILGEVKTNLFSCISRNDLKSENKRQLQKINDIENYLLNSTTRYSKPPEVKKYYIVLNIIEGIRLNSLATYELLKVSKLLELRI